MKKNYLFFIVLCLYILALFCYVIMSNKFELNIFRKQENLNIKKLSNKEIECLEPFNTVLADGIEIYFAYPPKTTENGIKDEGRIVFSETGRSILFYMNDTLRFSNNSKFSWKIIYLKAQGKDTCLCIKRIP